MKKVNLDVTASNYTTESKQKNWMSHGFGNFKLLGYIGYKILDVAKNDLFMKNIGHLKGLDCKGNNYASVSRQFVPFRTR